MQNFSVLNQVVHVLGFKGLVPSEYEHSSSVIRGVSDWPENNKIVILLKKLQL
jgi:hypothetical protein